MQKAACVQCGIAFERRKHAGDKLRFCSTQCARAFPRPTKENHPRWKGGTSKRPHAENDLTQRAVKEVGRCERCGSTEYLNGHHKIPRSVDRSRALDRDNIEVLCSACHAKEHPEIAPLVAKPHVRITVRIDCGLCGQPFHVKPSKVPTARYCSKRCYWTAKKGKPVRH